MVLGVVVVVLLSILEHSLVVVGASFQDDQDE